MADIELIVKIPEEEYESIKKHPNWHSLGELIAHGTPLPKGHGNLVDVEEVKEYLDDIQQELDGWGETDSAIEIAKARMKLDSVSTIIEADKEGEDADSN